MAELAGNTVVDWYGYTRSWPITLNGASNTEVGYHGHGEVGAHNQVVGGGHAPLAKWPRPLVRKCIVMINQ